MENHFNSKSVKSLNIEIIGEMPNLPFTLSPSIKLIDFKNLEIRTSGTNYISFLDLQHLEQINSLLAAPDEVQNELNHHKGKRFKDSSIETYLKQTFFKSNNINEFLRTILENKNFKSFESIFLFVHPKGELTATKHEVSKTYKRHTDVSIKDFNQLFQAIKKSKKRSFGQTELRGGNFNILGTFIAREFSLAFHNIIFIISRNDFLSPTDEELSIFQELSISLPFFLNTFLYSHLENFKQEMSLKVFSKLEEVNKTEGQTTLGHQTDLFHHERLSLLGELLNTLRHELSNPLFGLQLSSQILKEDLANDVENLEFIDEISKNINRSQEIIKNFSELFLEKNLTKNIVLKDILEEVITLTKSETRGIIKNIVCEKEILLNSNPTFLVQVLFNLIVNSAQELHKADIYLPKITIKLDQREELIHIDIIDNGPGIDEATRKEIFKPFYTTKEKGTGLGLTISLNIIEKLQGSLSCEESTEGAHFKITLPKEGAL